MCLLYLFRGIVEGGELLKWRYLFWGHLLGNSNVEKWGDHRKRNFSINNIFEALILLKKAHQGPLKLHLHLGGFETKRNFVWSRIIRCEKVFQNLVKSCVSFGGIFDGSNEEKIRCDKGGGQRFLWQSREGLLLWGSHRNC